MISQTKLLQNGARLLLWLVAAGLTFVSQAQTLINVDFGAGATSAKTGLAATGQTTNDYWNLYSHYSPRFVPGMPQVADGRLEPLKFADGSASSLAIAVTNAPGVWGNGSGDPMFDRYIFAPNGSNILVSITGLAAGRYHFYLYGRADADAAGEQNSIFFLGNADRRLGPLGTAGGSGWQAGQPWREGAHYVVFRDVVVDTKEPVVIEVTPGPGGVAVLNGLQILSRGTSPPRLTPVDRLPLAGGFTNILFREIRYQGKLSGSDARFVVTLDAESRGTNEATGLVFEGDLALLSPKLPAGWRLVNRGRQFWLHADVPGNHRLEFELAAKVQIAEPWRQLSFTGPAAAIATVSATAAEPDTEIQLLSGTLVEGSGNEVKRGAIQGALGSDQKLALRWQGKAVEVTREAVVTVDTKAEVQIQPAAIRMVTTLVCDIVQSRLQRLRIGLSREQSLTAFQGDQVRDWRVVEENGESILIVEFLRPVEGTIKLVLTTDQPVASLPAGVNIVPPRPLGVLRESGLLSLSAEDVAARFEAPTGLRQINPSGRELAAYRFNTRPATLRAALTRIEPRLEVTDRALARLEETRFSMEHRLDLRVEQAGIYALELAPQAGFTVADVRGEGVDDWKVTDNKLRVSFRERVLGARALLVTLEQARTNLPSQLEVLPLALANAARQITVLGINAAAGVSLKTGTLKEIREIPAGQFASQSIVRGKPVAEAPPALAFRGEGATWQVTLAVERLAARTVAEVFNLITIGDGVVGGSATIRYGILNQGVQQFKVRLPAHWRNVDFTGANIRRQDHDTNVWTLSLQDKAWGGYTLVITFDYPFDAKKATIDAAGAHPLEVEREEGALAVTAAPGLTLEAPRLLEPLRPIDPTELSETDRALINRPVLLAARYNGTNFNLSLNLTRHEEVATLDAVADRAQLTSVLTETGEMLTQASFMVKNNERQAQRFQLPPGATLWGVAVNGAPAKADRDGDWLVIPLPRAANRNEAFAVDLKYAQQLGGLSGLWPRHMEFSAPKTDMAGTYAEWDLFVPASKRVAGFGGNMTAARGAAYGVRDAWRDFLAAYRGFWHDHGALLMFLGGGGFCSLLLIAWGRRRGFGGLMQALGVCVVLAILGGMMLPALSKAKAKAQRVRSVNNLKNIGVAARVYATENEGRLPQNLDEVAKALGTDQVLVDPETGERYTYAGANKRDDNAFGILAYSKDKGGRREVVLVDGSVQQVSEAQFGELLAKESLVSRDEGDVTATATASRPRRAGAGREGEQLADLRTTLGAAVSTLSDPAPASAGTPIVAANLPGESKAATIAPAGPPATDAPVVAGIKSLAIEVPRAGRSLQFTKVLNLNGEPAVIKVSLMSERTFVIARTLLQVGGFLCGLSILWLQSRQRRPGAFWVALGVALALASVAWLLLAWRALHLALIVGFAVVVIAGLLYLAWRVLREPVATGGDDVSGSGPATVVALLMAGFLATPCATAAEAGASAALARLPSPAMTNAVSIIGATFSGTARERVAELDARIEIISATTNQSVVLFGGEVAVREFAVEAGEARIWREGSRVGVLLPAAGPVTLKLKLLVRLGGEVGRKELALEVPPALASRWSLAIEEPDADVEFPTAVSFQRSTRDQLTLVEAVLGASGRMALQWTPRSKRAADVNTTLFVEQATLVEFNNSMAGFRSIFDYQIPQGEARELRVQIPAGHRVLRVKGESIRAWTQTDATRPELVVQLLRPVTTSYRLEIETGQALPALPAVLELALPRALEVRRQSGQVAVRVPDELGLQVEPAAGFERVERSLAARVFGLKDTEVTSAWRYLQPELVLRARAEALRPRVEAVARQQFTIGADQLSLRSDIEFAVSQAGIFTARFALPVNWQLEDVKSEAMQNWSERTENGLRFVELTLRQRTLGAFSVRLDCIRTLTNLPPTLELEAPHPSGVQKLSGLVSVSSESGVGIKTASLAGLVEVAAATMKREAVANSTGPAGGLLAFKFSPVESPATAPWRLSLATEALPAWVRAEVVNEARLGEATVTGRSVIRYEIENAPIKELIIKVPAAWRNVELTGGNIRRRDQTGTQWRVELQNRVRGQYLLTVLWEQPAATGTNQLELAGVETVGVERESGFVSIVAPSRLQVNPARTGEDLMRVDSTELPAWARARGGLPAGQEAVLNYRYLRPGWKLGVVIQRFAEASVLQALAEQVRLRTVVADDGQLMTHMELSVLSNGRQNLAVTLPAGMKLWSAFVGRQPVRPTQNGATLLLPLETSGPAGLAVPVEIIYVGASGFARSGGSVELLSPRLDVPLKDARWELFLPPDYEYGHFQGSMTYESADLAAVVQDFTGAEYRRQEAEKTAAHSSLALDSFRQARSNLALGRFAEAANTLDLARQQGVRNEMADSDLKKLEEDISRVQSSNLIRAQKEYFALNNTRFGADIAPQTEGAQYDTRVAEQQVRQLKKAQAVVANRAQPLRANLPTRGLRHSFTQVLQTEVDKPLQIRFSARNDRETGWGKTGLLLAGGFLGLWAVSALVIARQRTRLVSPVGA